MYHTVLGDIKHHVPKALPLPATEQPQHDHGLPEPRERFQATQLISYIRFLLLLEATPVADHLGAKVYSNITRGEQD